MKFFYFFIIIDFLLSTISYIYCRLNFGFAKTWSFFFCYVFLAVNMIGSRLLPESTPLILLKASSWLSGLWLAFIYYSVILAIIHSIIWLGGKLFSVKLPNYKIACAGLLCMLAFITWGSFRAFNPTIRTEEITTAKLPTNTNYKIVLVSDIHLGRLLGKSYAENLVEKINAQEPDLVLLAGDILDEKLLYVTEQDSLSPLAKLKAPLGVYAVYGNHDYLDKPLVWQQMLEANNITVLRDANAIVDNKLKLTGLNDFSRNRSTASLEKLSTDNANYYSIVIDHQPRKMEAASLQGYDLYVAGHTHTGQLFPNRLVTKKMYKLDYGRKEFGNLTAITSNGYGFWGVPVRTEVAPEFVVINLKSQ